MTAGPPTASFWAQYGPNHFETLLLGGAAGLLVATRVGIPVVVPVALGIAIVSYVVRRFLPA